jgi:hypothetical protein
VTRPPSRRTVAVVGAAALTTAVALAGCSGSPEPSSPASAAPSASASASDSTTTTPSPSATSPSATPTGSSATTPSATRSTATSSATTTRTATTSPTASRTSVPAGPSVAPTETASVPTVGEVYREARTSALSAGSGHVKGTQTRDGRRLRIDVEGVANGSNQRVLITTPEGGTAEVITVDDRYWLGGDEAFWVEQTGDAKAGRAMVGKYVPITASDATELGSFTLRSILTEKFSRPEFAALESDTRPATEGSVAGRGAYVLSGGGGARLWVAADGSGALLRAVGPRSARSDLTFSGWDRAQTVSPPPPSKVVDEG